MKPGGWLGAGRTGPWPSFAQLSGPSLTWKTVQLLSGVCCCLFRTFQTLKLIAHLRLLSFPQHKNEQRTLPQGPFPQPVLQSPPLHLVRLCANLLPTGPGALGGSGLPGVQDFESANSSSGLTGSVSWYRLLASVSPGFLICTVGLRIPTSHSTWGHQRR